MISKQDYINYLKDFSEKVSEEDLKKAGIKSVAILQEVLTTDPIEPKMIVKYADGTQEDTWGMENISKRLNKIFENL